jgi:hypothetical protein
MVKIEEFMVFEDENGEVGVIIKNKESSCYAWKKVYVSGYAEIFDEILSDEDYLEIAKLYKHKDGYNLFSALIFMTDSDLNMFDCVYDKSEKSIEVKIKAAIDNGDLQEINQVIDDLQEKLSHLKIKLTLE